jgi:hypothetical protein
MAPAGFCSHPGPDDRELFFFQVKEQDYASDEQDGEKSGDAHTLT